MRTSTPYRNAWPLTQFQRALLNRYNLVGHAQHTSFRFTPPAEISANDFLDALLKVLESHAVLRSTVTQDSRTESPKQYYRPDLAFPVSVVPHGVPFTDAISQNTTELFNLEVQLPVRIALALSRGSVVECHITVHHISFDRTSMWHIAQEVTDACTGQGNEKLQEVRFPTFALDNRPSFVDTDHLHQGKNFNDGLGVIRQNFGKKISEYINQLPGSPGAPYIALAAFVIALGDESPVGKVLFPVGTRPPGSSAVGPYVRMLEANLSDLKNEPLIELACLIRRALGEANRRARTLAVTETSNVAGTTVGFNFTRRPLPQENQIAASVNDIWGAHGAEVAWRLDLEESSDGWSLALFYADAFISKPAAMKIVKRFEAALPMPLAILSSPDSLNSHQKSFAEKTIDRLRVDPDRLAVAGSGGISRKQLEAWACHIAFQLKIAGTQPGDVVAVSLRNGPSTPAAFLGVLLAGAVYLPIDPRLPTARRELVLSESQATALIIDKISDPPTNSECAAVNALRFTLKLDHPPLATNHVEFAAVRQDEPAYLIYTSGSTGRPKGVLVSHGNLNNLGLAVELLLKNQTLRTSLLAASPSFDAHIWEMVIAMTTGATLITARADNLDEVRSAYEMSELVTATPSLLSLIATEIHCPKVLISVGERLDAQLAKTLQSICQLLVNAYGPTEATVCTSFARLGNDTIVDPIPIGRPISGVSMYVLGEDLRPAAMGIEGELYIGGAGVALAYLDQPKETASAFLPDPFCQTYGARMYRTGDRAILGGDGQVVYVGRNDDQIKINGQRVDIGEVSAVINSNPRIRASVVVSTETVLGTRMSAYVVSDEDNFSSEDLRFWLSSRVPKQLVPTWITQLPRLPLTSSGKIDRSALPDPLGRDGNKRDWDSEAVDSTELEEKLVSIWKEVLKAEQIDRFTDILRSGASSLDVTRAVWAMRQLIPEASIADIYKEPVIARHASIMIGLSDGLSLSPLVSANKLSATATPLQEQLHLISMRNPEDSRYNVPLVYQLSTPLDTEKLQSVFQRVCRWQTSLHSGIVERSGVISFERHSIYSSPSVETLKLNSTDSLDRWLNDWVRMPFDHTRPPLIRVTQVESPKGFLLAFLIHHSIFDAESVSILQRNFTAAWNSEDLGIPPAPFNDWLMSRDMPTSKSFDYWTNHLAGIRPLTGQDLHSTGSPKESLNSGVIRARLDRELMKPLKSLVRATKSSTFVVLLTALQVVLAGRTGRRTFVTSTPISLRRDPRWDATIGCFVDSVHMRADVRFSQSVFDAVSAMRDKAIAAIEHSTAPLSGVLHALRKHGQVLPLAGISFQVIDGAPVWNLGNTQLINVQPPSPGHRLDIQFQVTAYDDRLEVDAIYDKEQFDSSYLNSMIKDLNGVLFKMLNNTNQPLQRSLSAVTSRPSLLPSSRAPKESSIPDDLVKMVLHMARTNPSRVAVSDETRILTYEQLMGLSWALAENLELAGVEPGDPVAVLTERSVDLAVAMLGCLIRRAVYVPLDTRSTSTRIQYALEDSGATLCVTDQQVPPPNVSSIRIHDLQPSSQWDDPRSVVLPVTSTSAAYLIYTSGSTGKPKGVIVEYRNLSTLIRVMAQFYDQPEALRVGLMAPVSFDASWKSLVCLGYGHQLVIVGHKTRRDSRKMIELLRQGLDVMDATPHDLPNLQERRGATTLVGGDVFGQSRWNQAAALRDFWNVYGPTECTVFVAHTRITEGAEHVGFPVDGTSLYVLDDRLRPVPLGTTGELYIGGASVARGYQGNPLETAKVFLPDPYTENSGERMYRTGDLAVMRPEGSVKFVGRTDDQVKIRGHRVEPNEVNAALELHPDVVQSIIVPVGGEEGTKLAAYVTPVVGKNPTTENLRLWMAAKLPDYMTPSWFTILSDFPLTGEGKVNRAALPMPLSQREKGYEFVEAEQIDDLQGILIGLWQDILEVKPVRPDDNFFDLGGDSISAMQLAARASAAGIEVRSADVFEAQTVLSLRNLISNRSGAVKEFTNE